MPARRATENYNSGRNYANQAKIYRNLECLSQQAGVNAVKRRQAET